MSTIPKFIDAGQPAGIRSETETFLLGLVGAGGTSTKAIAKGDWLVFDDTMSGTDQVLYVKTAVAAALGAVVVGVALEAVSVDEPATVGAVASARVRVCTSGYAVAKVTGSTAAKAPLSVDTTDGTGTLADAANAIVCGQALDAESGGFAPCWVFKRF